MESMGVQELYDVILRAKGNLAAFGKEFSDGEVFARFDKIQMSTFRTDSQPQSATGGFFNDHLVGWENINQVDISFSQGVFTENQWALFSNSELITENSINLPKRERLTVFDGKVALQNLPLQEKFFLYGSNGVKEIHYQIEGKTISFSDKADGETVIVDYEYLYNKVVSIINVGEQLLTAEVELIGKTRFVGDKGTTVTGLITIPRLRILNNFIVTLGREVPPLMTNFLGRGYLDRSKGGKTAIKVTFLQDDIDSDF